MFAPEQLQNGCDKLLPSEPALPWFGTYLCVLAILYALGGVVHIGNIFGYGDRPWSDSPIAWRVGDVVYGVVDFVAAIGLWRRAMWGLTAFVLAACSQLVLYLGWPHVFAFTGSNGLRYKASW